nr:hypothetical protein [uncultured Chryseobacterium sp.]
MQSWELKAAFTTKEGGSWAGGHSIHTFVNNRNAFTKAFNSGKNKKDVINNFVHTMKDNYNITVTVRR